MSPLEPFRPEAPDLKAFVRQKYDAIAPRYDWVLGAPEVLGLHWLRRALLRHARGQVLEIAVGTGRNLVHYPRGCELTAIDFSAPMLARAEQRAQRLGLRVDFRIMDAEQLGFPPHQFDTVVCTLALCTFPHPLDALHEMLRVVRPEGRVLLLEHGYADRTWLRKLQDLRVERQFRWLGSRWDREPHLLVQEAGLELVQHRRLLLGVLNWMVARPAAH